MTNNKELQLNTINNNSFNAIDVAKFICSILVVMIHIPPFGNQIDTNIFYYLNFIFQNGICRIAVPLFFIFSGFFLYKKTPLNEFSIEPTKKYVLSILKLYLIWSVIYLPISLNDLLVEHKNFSAVILFYIRDFFLEGSYIHLWYLNSLWVAVVITSFLLYKKLSPKKIVLISFLFCIIGLLGSAYEGIIRPLYSVPFIGKLIDLYFIIFSSTRNGLLFPFFFVSLGMYLSDKKINITSKKSLILFIGSTILMCVETMLLKTFDMAKSYDVLIFSIPATIFCFLFLTSLSLKNRPIYKKLRELSSLIYYLHYLVLMSVVTINGTLKNNSFIFLIVLLITILTSLVIIKINKKKIKFY